MYLMSIAVEVVKKIIKKKRAIRFKILSILF